MTLIRNGELSSKWAMIVSIQDGDKMASEQLREFGVWFMETLKKEGALIGHLFTFDPSPAVFMETRVGDFTSCTNAYQSIQKSHPQAIFVLHILPGQGAKEHDWMKALAERYGFLRQGILYENAVNRFETVGVTNAFRSMAYWIYRSGLMLARGDANPCGLLVGKDTKPTIEKLVFNPEDIHEAVAKVLHGGDYVVVSELESSVRVSGFPSNLNSFGIAQLLTPFRVIGVTQTGRQEAHVVLENKFHSYQAVREINKRVIDRNHTLKVSAVGSEVLEKLRREKVI